MIDWINSHVCIACLKFYHEPKYKSKKLLICAEHFYLKFRISEGLSCNVMLTALHLLIWKSCEIRRLHNYLVHYK